MVDFRDKLSLRLSLPRVLNMWVIFTACLLDIYFLIRMAKQRNSYITIGFFGHQHCNALGRFLETELYDFKYSSKESGRCLKLNGRLDLNEDLRKYNRLRSAFELH